MGGKTKRSKSEDIYYKSAALEKRAEKNQEKRVLKHLTKHPNDAQAVERPKADYTQRRKPNVPLYQATRTASKRV